MKIFTEDDVVAGLKLLAPNCYICLITNTSDDGEIDQEYRAYSSFSECVEDVTGSIFERIINSRVNNHINPVYIVSDNTIIFTPDDTVDFFDNTLVKLFSQATPNLPFDFKTRALEDDEETNKSIPLSSNNINNRGKESDSEDDSEDDSEEEEGEEEKRVQLLHKLRDGVNSLLLEKSQAVSDQDDSDSLTESLSPYSQTKSDEREEDNDDYDDDLVMGH